MIFRNLVTSLVLVFVSSLHAEPLVFESTQQQSVVVELYTSEGCSSCPPAERFLNRFAEHPDLWKKFIPMAFHVDYWDYLGWKDRFSRQQFSQRQRQYAQLKKQSTVYTPAFMVNGDNWRSWYRNPLPDKTEKNVGKLRIELEQGRVRGHFIPVEQQAKNMVLNLALLGMDLHTDIRAGENQGKQARHHFVVLSLSHYPLDSDQWDVPAPVTDNLQASRLAIVAWLSRPGELSPLQAVGGYLPQPAELP